MKKIDFYLVSHMLLATCGVLALLIGIDAMIFITSELDEVGHGSYTFPRLLLIMALHIPEQTYVFFPASVLVGCMLGLAQLSARNELTVLRSSGVGIGRISLPGLFMCLILGVLIFALDALLVPQSSQHAASLRAMFLEKPLPSVFGKGFWLRERDAFIHIASLNAQGELEDLHFVHFEPELMLIHAERAHHAPPEGWRLQNVQQFTFKIDKIFQNQYQEQIWHSELSPANLSALGKPRDMLSLRELHRLIGFMKANRLPHPQESLRYWQKIFMPLYAVTMLLLGLPFAFTTNRRSHRGLILLIGMILGVAYYLFSEMITNLTLILLWPPWLGALLPVLLFSALPLYRLRRL